MKRLSFDFHTAFLFDNQEISRKQQDGIRR